MKKFGILHKGNKSSKSFTNHLLSQACYDEAENDEKHNEVSSSHSVGFPNNTEFRYDFSEIKRNNQIPKFFFFS